jgi:hypothetical protein
MGQVIPYDNNGTWHGYVVEPDDITKLPGEDLRYIADEWLAQEVISNAERNKLIHRRDISNQE